MSIFRRFRYLAKKRKEIFSAFVAVIFIAALLWFANPSRAITYTFSQSSWSGGATSNVLTKTTDNGSWNQYESKDDGVAAGANITIVPISGSVVQTTAAAFNGGTFSNTSVMSALGNDGGIKLSRKAIDPANENIITVTPNMAGFFGGANSAIMKLDSKELPHAVYRNDNGALSQDYYYIRFDGAAWSLPFKFFSSLLLQTGAFAIGPDDKLHFVIRDQNANSVKYISCAPSSANGFCTTGGWTAPTTIVSWAGSGQTYQALTTDASNRLHLVINRPDLTAPGQSGQIEYFSCDVSSSCGSAPLWGGALMGTVNSQDQYIALDSQSRPRILSTKASTGVNGDLILWYCNSDGATCAAGGTWTSRSVSTLVDQNSAFAQGFKLDNAGNAHISYFYQNSLQLLYAFCPWNSGSSSYGACTSDIVLAGPASNTGKYSDIAIDRITQKPLIAFRTNSDEFRIAVCTGICTSAAGWVSQIYPMTNEQPQTTIDFIIDSQNNGHIYFHGTANGNKGYYTTMQFTSTSGTYTSSIINPAGSTGVIWGIANWNALVPSGSGLSVKIRSSNSATMSGAPAFSGCPAIISGADITGGCVTDGDTYVQYELTMTGSNTATPITPIFNDITFNYTYVPASALLGSSRYNTQDPTTLLSKISWTETTPAGSAVAAAFKSAPDQTTLASNPFIGPGGTSDAFDWYWGGATCPRAATGVPNQWNVICTLHGSHSTGEDDQWFQYNIGLLSLSGGAVPIVDDIKVEYVINNRPVVSAVTASQGSDGKVAVNYTVSDQDQSNTNISLLYDLGVKLGGTGLTASCLGTPISIVTTGNLGPLPSSGTIQIDSEQMTYTGKTANSLNGVVRTANNTRCASHAVGAPIWFKAVSVTGDVGNNINNGNRSIIWTPKADIPSVYTATARARVSSNDGQPINQVGFGDSANFILDTKDPIAEAPLASCPEQYGIVANDGCPPLLRKTNNSTIALKLNATDDRPLQMQISDDGVFDTETWGGYSATKSWPLTNTVNGTKTIRVNFKDDKGNTAGPYSATIEYDTKWPDDPVVPDGIGMQELSNPSTGEIFFFVSWPRITNTDNDFYRYNIYRSSDGASFSLIKQFTSDIENNFIDNPCPLSCIGSPFWYRYEVEDNTGIYDNNAGSDTGNVSPPSPAKQITATGQTPDSIPPTLNSPSIGSPGVNYVPVTWTTSETPSSDRSDSEVAYYLQSGGLLSGAQVLQNNTFIAQGGTHEVNILGLEPGQSYYLQARSNDQSNNVASASTSPEILTFPDGRSANSLSFTQFPQIMLTSARSAVISWQTNNPASSIVEYNNLVYGSFDMATQHTVVLPYTLDPGVSINFTAKSHDSWGGEVSSSGSFNTTAITDNTPPVISNILGTQNGSSATITWDTNEPASSYVEFGTDIINGKPVYTRTVGTRALSPAGAVSPHSVSLPADLLPDNWTPGQIYTYFYRTRSIDGAGNETISDKQDIQIVAPLADTTAPSIQSVVIAGARENSALVTFTTVEPADALIEYAEGGSTTYILSRFIPTHTTNHAVEIIGLKPATLYKFQITVKDAAGNASLPNDNGGVGYTLATLRSTVSSALTISDVQVVAAEGFTRVKFNTNEPAVGYVEYGFDDSFGEEIGEVSTASAHEIVLPKDTLGNVTYRFQIRARAADGREVISRDVAVFTTPASAATTIADDTTPPAISQITVPLTTYDSAVINWITDEAATTELDYGLIPLYGFTASTTLLGQTHSLTLTGLEDGATYYFRVGSRNARGNLSQTNKDAGGADLVFTTKTLPSDVPPPVNDTTPPSLTGVTVSDITAEGATITWTTNKAANSLVEYGVETGAYAKLAGQTTDSDTTHTAVLTDLDPITTYYFIAVSYDGSANRGESDEQSFETLAASEEEQALEDLKKKIEIEATEDQIQLLKDLLGLSSSTQDLIRQFLLIPEDERDTALDVLLGQIIGPPRIISDIPDVKVTDSTADISWDTSKKMSSAVGYASQKLYKEGKDDPYVAEVKGPKDEFIYKHSLKLEGLEPNTLYHYQLRGTEKSGKQAMSIDRTFKTLPQKVVFTSVKVKSVNEETVTVLWSTSISAEGTVEFAEVGAKEKKSQGDPQFKKAHELALIGLKPKTKYTAVITAKTEEEVFIKSQPFSFTTGVDTVAPEISQVRTKLSLVAGKTDVVQAVISWNTDEPADGQIFYDEGLTKGEIMRQSSPLQSDLTTYHVVVLSKLRPGTVYRFQAVSRDATGNDGSSQEFKIITPRKEESVLELIIKNFEDTFGFLQQINN